MKSNNQSNWKTSNIPDATDNTLLLVKKNNEEHYVHFVYKIKDKFLYSIMYKDFNVDYVSASELEKYYSREIEWCLVDLNLREDKWTKICGELPSPKKNSILLISADPSSHDYYPNIVITNSADISEYVLTKRDIDEDSGEVISDTYISFGKDISSLYKILEEELYYYCQDLDTIDTLRSVFNEEKYSGKKVTHFEFVLIYKKAND